MVNLKSKIIEDKEKEKIANKRVEYEKEMGVDRFLAAIPIYKKTKNSSDPKMREVSEYSVDLFVQYFALANRIGGMEMMVTLNVIRNKCDTPRELIERGEAEARRQGVKLLYTRGSK